MEVSIICQTLKSSTKGRWCTWATQLPEALVLGIFNYLPPSRIANYIFYLDKVVVLRHLKPNFV